MIKVVNIKTHSDEANGRYVYIGRKMPRLAGSALGNPFKPSNYKDPLARQKCLDKYQTWLTLQKEQRTNAWSEVLRLAEVAKTEDIYLGCWCAPQSCHGDILKAVIEEILSKETRR